MTKIINIDVKRKFSEIPEPIKTRLLYLRQLILDTASKTRGIGDVEETLKWGDPSYLTKTGSTIRLGYDRTRPDRYAMFFNCKSRLVDTFKELYGEKFVFEGNRAIVFNLDDEVPVAVVRHCIALSLNYHRLKHLPLLGE